MKLINIVFIAVFAGVASGQIVIDRSESVEEDGTVRVHPSVPDNSGFYGRFPMDAVPEGYTLIRYKRSLDSRTETDSKEEDNVVVEKAD